MLYVISFSSSSLSSLQASTFPTVVVYLMDTVSARALMSNMHMQVKTLPATAYLPVYQYLPTNVPISPLIIYTYQYSTITDQLCTLFCSILYKAKLPFIVVMNKVSHVMW